MPAAVYITYMVYTLMFQTRVLKCLHQESASGLLQCEGKTTLHTIFSLLRREISSFRLSCPILQRLEPLIPEKEKPKMSGEEGHHKGIDISLSSDRWIGRIFSTHQNRNVCPAKFLAYLFPFGCVCDGV